MKKSGLKNFSDFTGKRLACSFIKKTSTQVLSCEICEIFKNTYFEEHLQMAASVKSCLRIIYQKLFNSCLFETLLPFSYLPISTSCSIFNHT